MTIEDLAEYLKLSVGTLYNKVYARKIPFYKIDGAVRFKKEDIDGWIGEKILPENPNKKLVVSLLNPCMTDSTANNSEDTIIISKEKSNDPSRNDSRHG